MICIIHILLLNSIFSVSLATSLLAAGVFRTPLFVEEYELGWAQGHVTLVRVCA